MKNLTALTLTALAVCAMTCSALAGGPAAFKDKPTVSVSGEQVKVRFSVTGSTDVEVVVLDKDGKAVRHLAAGVLGGQNPPPPPLEVGLAQELTWDGKDDAGQAVADVNGCRVRVRIGMGVAFGRTIGGSPYSGSVNADPTDSLAVDEQGTLYVKMGSFVPQLHEYHPWQIRKFDKTGAYLNTVLPYPPSTDPSKAPAFQLLNTADGLLTPANNTPLDPVVFHLGDSIHRRLIGGQLVFVDGREGKLNFVKMDGSNALKSVPMRTRPDKLKWPNWLNPQVAFSPDGKYAYYSNVAGTPSDGKKPADIDPKFPQGRVYRHDISNSGTDPAPFFDLTLPDFDTTKYWMPSAWDKKTAAAGIDTDAKGNVLVGDLVNQEVVEISPDGKKLSATKVDWPDKVVVSRKTGALYVISRKPSRNYPEPATLVKITGRGETAKVEAKLPIKSAGTNNNNGMSVTLDESGANPVVWVAGGVDLIRVEDRGTELAVAGAGGGPAHEGGAAPAHGIGSILNPDKNAISFVCFGDVDREADLVYVTEGMGRVWRYNGETGEGGLTPIKACDLAVGPGGMVYGWGDTGSYAGPITRYTRELKPAPLANGKNTYGSLYGRYGRGNNAPGMAVDSRGWVYAICGFNDCNMRVYNADGKLVEYEHKSTMATDGNNGKGPEIPVFLSYVLDEGGSVRVDKDFNVYVLEIGLPKGFVPPKGFEKDPAYRSCTGTIWKFTPKGGTFTKDKDGRWFGEGSIKTYAGCAPISGNWNSTMSVCHCNRPRFDVDPSGRLYIPNALTYKVSVRDNADNEILSFGGYGNFDAEGPKSNQPKPDIAIGWPIFSMASDKHIYVGDCLNDRVVRVDKTFAAEETVGVK